MNSIVKTCKDGLLPTVLELDVNNHAGVMSHVVGLSSRRAYNVDVAPILAKARAEAGGAIDVLEAYRLSQYRDRKAQERKAVGLGAGIV